MKLNNNDSFLAGFMIGCLVTAIMILIFVLNRVPLGHSPQHQTIHRFL